MVEISALPSTAKADVVALARQCTRHAVECLFRIMIDESTPKSVKVAAATALLDRGWGKPPQAVAVAIAEPERLAALHTTLLALQGKRIRFIDGDMVVEGGA